ncbi:HNH endonuclease [Paracoccus sp. SSK6]|uniref:HNH endonuclease n=1 Tax=Paracoccus sp. SSK6 TaxID=3143131 RepID=UPI00321C102B
MKGQAIYYLPQELAWIEAHRSMPRREAHAEFCRRWERDDVSLSNYAALCKRHGWMTGRTGRFEKGQAAHNKGKPMPFNANSAATRFKAGQRSGRAAALHKPIGTERISRDGYVERKVNDGLPMQRRWRGVHLIRWEEANGPLPQGHALKCLDGDRANTDPSNWEVVPRSMLPFLAGTKVGRHYDSAPAALKPTVMAVAKVRHAASKARKAQA